MDDRHIAEYTAIFSIGNFTGSMVKENSNAIIKWFIKAIVSSLLFLSSVSFAQTKKLDSLLGEINGHAKRDTVRIDKIMKYVVASANENTSLLLPYLNEMITLSKEMHFKKGLQSGYITAQLYYSDRGNLEHAMRYADSAFTLLKADTGKEILIKQAYLHHNVGGDYLKMEDYAQSLSHFTEAAMLLEHYQPEVLSGVYSGIGLVYEKMLQSQKAIEYDKKAIASAEKYGSKSAIAKRRLNYIVKLINMEKFVDVKHELSQIESLVKEVDASFTWFLFYQNKGYLLRSQKNYDGAIASFKKAKDYAKASDDQYQYLSILDPLCKALMETGRLNEARPYIDTLLEKGAVYQMKFAQLSGYSNGAEWYTKKGDYKMAYEYLVLKMNLSDSISSTETKDKIAMMEARFKVQGKDNEIRILQDEKKIQQLSIRQKHTLNLILIGGTVALLMIFLLSYRNYRHRQKLQLQRISELETEKQLAAAEAVLKGEEQERARLAKDLHDGLGGMLSGIKHSFTNMKENLIMTPENALAFSRGIELLDGSIKEMRRVAHNMMPEILMQFGLDTALKEFCIELGRNGSLKTSYQPIDMDTVSFDQNISVTAYRVVQELANNALKHAAATSLLVQAHASTEDGLLQLTVEDNGKGFDTTILGQSGGMGWKNIRNRLELLKGRVDIHTSPGRGTSVLIEIPLS